MSRKICFDTEKGKNMNSIYGELVCEYQKNPLGLDAPHPRLSWQMVSPRRGAAQSAYRLQVSKDQSFAGTCWDTGRVTGNETLHIPYAGSPLESFTRYYWRVKLWDERGAEWAWSDAAWFETAMMARDDWKAPWVSPREDAAACHYVRREIRCLKPVKRARIYASACGVYDLLVGGEYPDRQILAPGWTSYFDHIHYQTYDVTEAFRSGSAVVGAILGDGWYKGRYGLDLTRNNYGSRRALRLQLELWYEDGGRETVCADAGWRCSTGPILSSELYDGEVYDARLELDGWDREGYDDSRWETMEEICPPRLGRLSAQPNEPIRPAGEIHPAAVFRTPNGDTLLDMGQNMVGWMRIRVKGKRGDRVCLQFAEVLDRDGNFYRGNLRSARQEEVYFCRGDEEEVFEPHFTFSGFRYVRVAAFPGKILAENFTGVVFHSDMRPTGSFSCSDPRINRLWNNILWSERSNFMDVPLDCPQRDERLGWTGDAQIFCRTANFGYRAAPFFEKWLRDVRADQYPNGAVPFTVPNLFFDGRQWDMQEGSDVDTTSAAWADCITFIPWTLYEMFGDKQVLADNYEAMKKHVEHIRSSGGEELFWGGDLQLGDWVALDAEPGSYYGATDVTYVATCYYALSARILGRAAALLGHPADAREYGSLSERVVQALHKRYFSAGGEVLQDTQTAQVLALSFGIAQGEERRVAAEKLARLVEKKGGHLDTGFVGTPYLCRALSQNGKAELAYSLLLREDFPSWLYQVKMGATTIWEHWDGILEDGSFWSENMNSFNHYSYGSVGEWLFREAAGIDSDAEKGAGFGRVLIRPAVTDRLEQVSGVFYSMRGPVESHWSRRGRALSLRVAIPAGATAEVTLPAGAGARVTESGRELAQAVGVRVLRREESAVVLEVLSGEYRFCVE
jgi:alpha-L-rhamnosidase